MPQASLPAHTRHDAARSAFRFIANARRLMWPRESQEPDASYLPLPRQISFSPDYQQVASAFHITTAQDTKRASATHAS